MDTPPDSPATDNGTTPTYLPEGAVPIEGMPGYHHAGTSLYGPANEVIGTDDNRTWSSVKAGWLGTPGTQAARIVGSTWDALWQAMARQHQLAQQPTPDAIWIEHTGERSAIYGTIRGGDHDVKALIKQAGGFTWAPTQNRYVIPSNWKSIEKRDDRVRKFLELMVANGRYPQILGAEDAARRAGGQLPAPAVTSVQSAVTSSQASPDVATGTPEPAVQQPVPGPRPVGEFANGELAKAITDLEYEVKHKYATPEHRDVQNARLAELKAEMARRQFAKVQEMPVPSERPDLKDLEADRTEVVRLQLSMERGSEEWKATEARLTAIGAEYSVRVLAEYETLPEPAEIADSDELAAEYARLDSARIYYPHWAGPELSAKAKERQEAVEAELDARESVVHAAAVARATINSRGEVFIDGAGAGRNTSSVTYRQGAWRISRHYHSTDKEGYRSKIAAMAVLVDEYDRDPRTFGVRTWGQPVYVFVPVSFQKMYVVERAADAKSTASPANSELFEHLKSSWGTTTDTDPVTKKSGQGHRLDIPRGLLGEFERIVMGLEERLTTRSTDRSEDKGERDRAKRQLAGVYWALRSIRNARAGVRAAGDDDDRKILDAAQAAAEAAALGLGTADDLTAPTEGPADHSEQIRAEGTSVLGDVPAAGVVGDGGSDPVLHPAGDGRPDGDRGAGGGDGAAVPAERRLPGAAGAAQPGTEVGGGSGAGGDGVPDSGAGPGEQRDAPQLGRYVIAGLDELAPTRPEDKAVANLAAIKTLAEIKAHPLRTLTESQRATLIRWSGWGSIPVVFQDEPREDAPEFAEGGQRAGRFAQAHRNWDRYSPVRNELIELLSPTEWRQAAHSKLSAYYTPPGLLRAMWAGLRATNFDGGEVLEPGCGVGNAAGTAPDDLPIRITGIEIEPKTAQIAAVVYPEMNVINESFGDTDAPPGTFDAVIANFPFGPYTVSDPRFNPQTTFTIHNLFGIKSGALLREGGVGLFITTRFLLDAEGAAARAEMAKYVDLLGAQRLPAGAFRWSGADVVTDVLMIRRRAAGEAPRGADWLQTRTTNIGGHDLAINEYFLAHPENVIGELTAAKNQFNEYAITVVGEPDCGPALEAGLTRIAQEAVAAGLGYEPHPDGPDRPPLNLIAAKERAANDFSGRLSIDEEDGRIWQHVNGLDPVEAIPSDGNRDQLTALIQMRDLALELQQIDRDPEGDRAAGERVRGALKTAYTAFTAQWGPLSKPGRHLRQTLPDGEQAPTAFGWFRADPQSGAVLGLERWDRDLAAPVISDVLDRRPGTRAERLTRTDNAKIALATVLGRRGGVDLDEIAAMLGVDAATARERLGTDVFDDPETGKLVHAAQYLTGPVRHALDVARLAAETDPTYTVNVAALEAVQPRPRQIGEFTITFGAGWIPDDVVQAFLRHILGDPDLRAQNTSGLWSIKAGSGVLETRNREYGVYHRRDETVVLPDTDDEPGAGKKDMPRVSAINLALKLLHNNELRVTDTYVDDKGKVSTVVDKDATRELKQKAAAMRSRFETWVLEDKKRAQSVTDAYNERMNGHIVRSYDGQAPSLEGFTDQRTLMPHQLAGAARMLHEPGVLLAHEVGLGKTTTMIVGLMALKNAERITKPYVVVPNHLVGDWYDEAKFLFPNANVVTVTSDDLKGDKRRPMLEYLRANTFDLVVYSATCFSTIRMSPEYQDAYIENELDALRQQIKDEKSREGVSLNQSKLEERLARREAEIRRSDAPMRTPGEIYFDDLGHDYAAVDEAHEYKGIGLKSRLVNNPTADKAVDLHQKLSYLHDTRGDQPAVTLATGTPLTNSISEQYIMLRLCNPKVLKAYGVELFNVWAHTFGQTVERVEMAPDGSGVKLVERFSRFVNKQAMKTMWAMVADTKTAEDVGLQRPSIRGGRPQLVLVKSSQSQKAHTKELVQRGAAIHAGEPQQRLKKELDEDGNPQYQDDNMLWVANDGRAIAVDPRLYDPEAAPGNKLREGARLMAQEWHTTKDRVYNHSVDDPTPHPTPGGVILGFLNAGTPGGGGFNTYVELKKHLVEFGVPEALIAFRDNTNGKPEKLRQLKKRTNNGDIQILIGSTGTMGTGANVQNRAAALFHFDPDFRPSDMEQRNGRILRKGNQNEEVAIYFVGSEGSMDSWMFGLLTSKAEGLRDIQRPGGDDNGSVSEISEDEFDWAIIQAELAGNPYVRDLFEARNLVDTLEADQRIDAARRLAEQELTVTKNRRLVQVRDNIARRQAAMPLIRPVTGDAFEITVNGASYIERDGGGNALRQAAATALVAHTTSGSGPLRVVAVFGGLDVAIQAAVIDGDRHVSIGFPELPGSEIRYTAASLTPGGGARTILGNLRRALDKAPALQAEEIALLPKLEAEVADLNEQRDALDYSGRIAYARARANLLDDIIAALAEVDKLPPPPETGREEARAAENRKQLAQKAATAIDALEVFTATTPAPAVPVVQPRTTPTPDDEAEPDSADAAAAIPAAGELSNSADDVADRQQDAQTEPIVEGDDGPSDEPASLGTSQQSLDGTHLDQQDSDPEPDQGSAAQPAAPAPIEATASGDVVVDGGPEPATSVEEQFELQAGNVPPEQSSQPAPDRSTSEDEPLDAATAGGDDPAVPVVPVDGSEADDLNASSPRAPSADSGTTDLIPVETDDDRVQDQPAVTSGDLTTAPGEDVAADAAADEDLAGDDDQADTPEDGALFAIRPLEPQPPTPDRSISEDESEAATSGGDDATDVEEPTMTDTASRPGPAADADADADGPNVSFRKARLVPQRTPNGGIAYVPIPVPEPDDDPEQQSAPAADAEPEQEQAAFEEPGALFGIADIPTGPPPAQRRQAARQTPAEPDPPQPPAVQLPPAIEPYPDRISSRAAQASITRAAGDWNAAAADSTTDAATRLTTDLELVLSDVESLRVARVARDEDTEDDLNVEGYTELRADARAAADAAAAGGNSAAAEAAEILAGQLDTYLARFDTTVGDRNAPAYVTWSESCEPVMSLVPDYQWQRDGSLVPAEHFARRIETFLALGGSITVAPDNIEVRRPDGETAIAVPVYPGAERPDIPQDALVTSEDSPSGLTLETAAASDEEVSGLAGATGTEQDSAVAAPPDPTDAPETSVETDDASTGGDSELTIESAAIGDQDAASPSDEDQTRDGGAAASAVPGDEQDPAAAVAEPQPGFPTPPAKPDPYLGGLTPIDVVYAVERFMNATPGLLADMLRLAQEPEARRAWIISTSATAWSTRGWRGTEDPDGGSHERLQVTRDGLGYVIGGPTIKERRGTITWRAIFAVLVANTTPSATTELAAATAARRLAETEEHENADVAVDARARERELSDGFWNGAKAAVRAAVPSASDGDRPVAGAGADVEVREGAADSEGAVDGLLFVEAGSPDEPVVLLDGADGDPTRRSSGDEQDGGETNRAPGDVSSLNPIASAAVVEPGEWDLRELSLSDFADAPDAFEAAWRITYELRQIASVARAIAVENDAGINLDLTFAAAEDEAKPGAASQAAVTITDGGRVAFVVDGRRRSLSSTQWADVAVAIFELRQPRATEPTLVPISTATADETAAETAAQSESAQAATFAATEDVALFDVPSDPPTAPEETNAPATAAAGSEAIESPQEPTPAEAADPVGQVPLFAEQQDEDAYLAVADSSDNPSAMSRQDLPQNPDAEDGAPEPTPEHQQGVETVAQDAEQTTSPDPAASEPESVPPPAGPTLPPPAMRRIPVPGPAGDVAGDVEDLERDIADTERTIGDLASTPQWQQVRNLWGSVVEASRTTSAYLAAHATRADAGLGEWLNGLAVRAARNVSRGALALAGALARGGHQDTFAFRALMTIAGRAHEFVVQHTRLDATPASTTAPANPRTGEAQTMPADAIARDATPASTTAPANPRTGEAQTMPADAIARVDAAFAALLDHDHSLTGDPQWAELLDLRGAADTEQLQQAVNLARGLAARLSETADDRGARTALRYLAAVIPVDAPDLDAAYLAALDDVLDRFRDLEQRLDADEEPASGIHTPDPEADLIASLANEQDQLTIVSAYLTPNDFQDHQMGRLFGAMAQAHNRGDAWSLETAAATLPPDGPADAADAVRTVAMVRERMLRRGLPAAPLLAQQVLDVRATSAVEQTLSRNGAGSIARRRPSDRDPAADTRRSEQDAEQHHTVGARQ